MLHAKIIKLGHVLRNNF